MTPLHAYRFFDHLIEVILDGQSTGGCCSVILVRTAHGYQTALHVHPDADQLFCVIEGELTLWVGERVSLLRAGESLLAPRAVPHAFKNTGDGMLSTVVISHPAGLEKFVRAFGSRTPARDLPPLDTPPDMALAANLAAQGGIELLGPSGMLPSEFPTALRTTPPTGQGYRGFQLTDAAQ